jgi:serine/threonine protein kinase
MAAMSVAEHTFFTEIGSSSVRNQPVLIPDHELLTKIAAGAYGEVWLARNAVGTLRAVKIVRRDQHSSAESFDREFKGLQKFEPVSRAHPGLVDILTLGLLPGGTGFYYVMELADRFSLPQGNVANCGNAAVSRSFGADDYIPRTLRAELKARGALPAEEVTGLGLKLTLAIAHLHANGLVHRDVKPSNILFIDGEPKLADAGLVAAVDDARSLVGTAGYIAPEGPGKPQADIYALGKVLYEALFAKDRQEFPALPASVGSPDQAQRLELNEVLLKACALDPRERYADAETMHRELLLLTGGTSLRRRRVLADRWRMAKKVGAMLLLGAVLITIARNIPRHAAPAPLSSNPEALKFFRRAEWSFNHLTAEDNFQAVRFLNEAVRLDTNFVAAYYKLFECSFGPWGDKLPPHYNRMENMRWVAAQINRIRPECAEYYTVSSLLHFYDWRFDEAISDVQHALKLDQTFLRAHAFYAWYVLLTRGDAATAEREYELAERIDASDVIIQFHRAYPAYFRRDYAKAIKVYESGIKFERGTSTGFDLLARAYEAAGDYEKAIDAAEAGDSIGETNRARIEARYSQQRAILREKGPYAWWAFLLEKEKDSSIPRFYQKGKLYARIGNIEAAIQCLEKAFDAHEQDMIYLLLDDWWDSLRKDPRFASIVARMGMKPM